MTARTISAVLAGELAVDTGKIKLYLILFTCSRILYVFVVEHTGLLDIYSASGHVVTLLQSMLRERRQLHNLLTE